MKKLRYFNRFIFFTNCVLTVLSLGILSNYFWGGSNVGFFGVLQLITLPILACHALFFVYWVFKRSKWAMVSFVVLGISYFSFGDIFKLNNDKEPLNEGFTLMSYNAMGINRFEWIKIPQAGDSISTFINNTAPDILCIQEHSRIRYKQLRQYLFRTETPYDAAKSVQAIFSQFPIVGEGSLNLPKSKNNIIYADISIAKDTIRIYNVHLESFRIVPSDTDISSDESERLYQRMKSTIAIQREQAILLKKHISKSPYNVLVCGDFNNSQFSRVYRIITDGMEDSFQSKGKGWGATYRLKGLPMRIDYIFADEHFEIVGHTNYNVELSDHEPIMARLKLKSDK